MTTEPLQSRSIRPPSFGRDVWNFAFWTSLGIALAVFALVTLLGVVAGKSMVLAALLAAVGFGGGCFALAIERRRATYDQWHVVPVTNSAPPMPAKSPQPAEAIFVEAIEGTDLRLPEEPTAGAMRLFFKLVATRKAGWNERDARRAGYDRESWEELRDFFLNQGWGEWRDANNHKLGSNLTAAGVRVISKIAHDYPPSPFEEGANGADGTNARTAARTNQAVVLGQRVV